MSKPYTPTTEEVRASYLSALTHNHPMNVGEVITEFDRWLEKHENQIKAEAFDQGVEATGHAIFNGGTPKNPYRKEATGDA